MTQTAMDFDGSTFDRTRDGPRLFHQAELVFECIKDGRWRTLHAIAEQTRQPEASVSARLRDLRKPRYGGHTVKRRYIAQGVHEYRLEVAT